MSNNNTLNFALIGAAGYVAPRHMEAIKACGGRLVAAYDKFDSVGILDRFFPEASFFTEFERFDRHLDKLQRGGTKMHYLTVCSPNYLHDAHIRYGIRNNIKVICEKPVVLNLRNLESLTEIEREHSGEVNTILQLRLHPEVIKLKKKLESEPRVKKGIDLTYITSRGNWYYASWKGDITKSGGICTNIGIHFFDMLIYLFGNVEKSTVVSHTHDRSSGILELKYARVKWFLSINADTLPDEIKSEAKTTYRSLEIDNQKFDFSSGFENLHTTSYRQIIEGKGFDLGDTVASITLVEQIRNAKVESTEAAHPLAYLDKSSHPFKQ